MKYSQQHLPFRHLKHSQRVEGYLRSILMVDWHLKLGSRQVVAKIAKNNFNMRVPRTCTHIEKHLDYHPQKELRLWFDMWCYLFLWGDRWRVFYVVIKAYKFEILIDFLYYYIAIPNCKLFLLWQLHDYPSHANSKNTVIVNFSGGRPRMAGLKITLRFLASSQ